MQPQSRMNNSNAGCCSTLFTQMHNISLCNTRSRRFTLIYHEDSTECSLDPVEFKSSFFPEDCTLHQVKILVNIRIMSLLASFKKRNVRSL